ncbi:hypothetical protein [Embleya hyalina]|uniref:Polyketide synthase thioesterase domain-containing protein n=1 Tax=Embleya hyalina TaxID=516124 RepID=A0A401Z2I1_9ACTN|nr:hypothetical protein [Embleya hyalina]GCE01093.1 hypothetical protein EHYA_08840 [Embleya hyalina]
MNLNTTWTTLRSSSKATVSGGSDELILCADFHTTGRPEAGFAELVARLDHDATFWHVNPPVVAPDSGTAAPAYVRSWLEPVRAQGAPVRAVFGYCVGAVYAAALADELALVQEEAPQVLLFDPEPTAMATIRHQFGNVFGMLSSILVEEDVAETEGEVERLIRVEGMTVGNYAAQLYTTFRRVGERAFERAGLDQEYGAEMWALFSSFLSYLSFADGLDPRDRWLTSTALSSSGEYNGLNRLRGTGELGGGELVAREIRFEAGHGDLLRSDGVAQTVGKLLER